VRPSCTWRSTSEHHRACFMKGNARGAGRAAIDEMRAYDRRLCRWPRAFVTSTKPLAIPSRRERHGRASFDGCSHGVIAERFHGQRPSLTHPHSLYFCNPRCRPLRACRRNAGLSRSHRNARGRASRCAHECVCRKSVRSLFALGPGAASRRCVGEQAGTRPGRRIHPPNGRKTEAGTAQYRLFIRFRHRTIPIGDHEHMDTCRRCAARRARDDGKYADLKNPSKGCEM